MKLTQSLTLFVCLLALGSCSIFQKKTVHKDAGENSTTSTVITERRWRLVELAGKPVPDKVNGKEPFLLLHKNDSRYSASGGCNGLGGTFTLQDNGRIKFSQGMSTMMACENMEIENGLNKMLVAVDNYSLNGDNLSLNRARMAPLARFKAVK